MGAARQTNAMTNDNPRDALQDAVENGEPLLTLEVCPPMRLILRAEGSLDIYCTSTSIEYGGHAGVVQLNLTREAVKGLRNALVALGTTLDKQASGVEPQSTH